MALLTPINAGNASARGFVGEAASSNLASPEVAAEIAARAARAAMFHVPDDEVGQDCPYRKCFANLEAQHLNLDDLHRLLEGKNNLLIEGQAGTGKSSLIRDVIEVELRRIYDANHVSRKGRVGVAGTSGVSALQVGGRTIFSLAGIGRGMGIFG